MSEKRPLGEVAAEQTERDRTRWTAPELMRAVFPEPRWAVPDFVPEGLTILAGPPKVGKSWLGLALAVAVASGGFFLEEKVEAGDVLYLALEDPGRRLQERLAIVLEGDPPPERLTLETQAGRGAEAVALLSDWLGEHPDARLVVVDVLARVRAKGGKSDESAYADDYAFAVSLKRLADAHRIALVVVHHSRKQKAADFVEELNGTNGLAGAADTIAILRRARTEADAVLQITGRDVDEVEHALQLVRGRWTRLAGEASDYMLQETRRKIVAHLRGLGLDATATPRQLADALGIEHETAKKTTQRMAKDEQLVGGGSAGYRLPPAPLSLLSPSGIEPAPETGSAGDSRGDQGGDSVPEGGDRRDTPQEEESLEVSPSKPASETGSGPAGDNGDSPAHTRAREDGGDASARSEPPEPDAALSPEEAAAVARHQELFPPGTPVAQIRALLPSVFAAEERP